MCLPWNMKRCIVDNEMRMFRLRGSIFILLFKCVYMYTQLHACMVPSSSYAKLTFLWMSYIRMVWFGCVSSPSSSSFARSHSLVRFRLFVQFHHCSSVAENKNQQSSLFVFSEPFQRIIHLHTAPLSLSTWYFSVIGNGILVNIRNELATLCL